MRARDGAPESLTIERFVTVRTEGDILLNCKLSRMSPFPTKKTASGDRGRDI